MFMACNKPGFAPLMPGYFSAGGGAGPTGPASAKGPRKRQGHIRRYAKIRKPRHAEAFAAGRPPGLISISALFGNSDLNGMHGVSAAIHRLGVSGVVRGARDNGDLAGMFGAPVEGEFLP